MKDQRRARVKDQILDVRDLHTHFKTLDRLVKAVGGVSFSIPAGASVGIVGESGSGKTVTSLSMMRLIEPPGYIARCQLDFKGRELIATGRLRSRLSETRLFRLQYRGNRLEANDGNRASKDS